MSIEIFFAVQYGNFDCHLSQAYRKTSSIHGLLTNDAQTWKDPHHASVCGKQDSQCVDRASSLMRTAILKEMGLSAR